VLTGPFPRQHRLRKANHRPQQLCAVLLRKVRRRLPRRPRRPVAPAVANPYAPAAVATRTPTKASPTPLTATPHRPRLSTTTPSTTSPTVTSSRNALRPSRIPSDPPWPSPTCRQTTLCTRTRRGRCGRHQKRPATFANSKHPTTQPRPYAPLGPVIVARQHRILASPLHRRSRTRPPPPSATRCHLHQPTRDHSHPGPRTPHPIVPSQSISSLP